MSRSSQNILIPKWNVKLGLLQPIVFTFEAKNSHNYKDVRSQVLSSEKVLRLLIDDGKQEGKKESGKQLTMKEAEKIYDDMAAKTSRVILRFAGWFFHVVLKKLFPRGVHVSGEDEMLAANQAGPVVYVPTHKSYLDFILVTFACYWAGVPVPCIASGDNFRLPIIGWLAREHGAFFIKRKLDGVSQLYRVILSEYVRNILLSGSSMEVFIEAARSRSGRILPPKFGILNYVTRSTFDSNQLSNVQFVPVGISFEKVVDGGFSRELLGVPKKSESFFGIIKGFISSLFRSYGATYVNFGKPFSFHEFLLKQSFENGDDSFDSFDVQANTIRDLGTYVLKEAQKNCLLTDTSIVAFLIITLFREGIDLDTLKICFIEMKKMITERGYPVNENQDINEPLELIKDLLEMNPINKTIGLPQKLESILSLSFYSNQVFHVFFGESILFTVALSFLKPNLDAHQITEEELQNRFEDLLEILNSENVVIGPYEKKGFFQKCLWELIKMKLLSQVGEKIEISKDQAKEHYGIILIMLLRPIIDSYIIVIDSLKSFKAPIEDKIIMDTIHQNTLQLWKIGLLPFGETCSLDILKRSLDSLLRLEVISSRSSADLSSQSQSRDLGRETSFLRYSNSSISLSDSGFDMSLFKIEV